MADAVTALLAGEYTEKRDYRAGHCRAVGHFVHKDSAKGPAESAERINADIQYGMWDSDYEIMVGTSCKNIFYTQILIYTQILKVGTKFSDSQRCAR